LCGKGFQTSSDLKRHKRTRVHQEKVEQVAAAGGDIDDDEAIITGTGIVVTGSANTSGVLDHDDGQETPEFKVWPEGHDDESRNSAASSHQQQQHVESAADLLSNIQHQHQQQHQQQQQQQQQQHQQHQQQQQQHQQQLQQLQQQQPSTTSMETTVGYSSTIDMKALGGATASTAAVSSWSNSNPVNTTACKDSLDPLATSAGAASTSRSSTVDMNLLKWQGNAGSAASMPTVEAASQQRGLDPPAPPQPSDGNTASGRDGKRSSSLDSPGQDEERLTVVEGDDSSQDSASAVANPTTTS
jgi:hypothetical protein